MASGYVIFVGGELDGKTYCLPEIPSRYKAASYRPKPVDWSPSGVDFTLDTPLGIRETEYVLTEKRGVLFYVERELHEMSQRLNFDPRPAAEVAK